MLSRSTQRALLSGNQILCSRILKREHHCEPSSPLFDWRRRRDRSHWCPLSKEAAEAANLPLKGLHGYDVETNWTLAFESVHPHHQAFRNLHQRGLAMYFQGTKDQNHALHTTIQSKPVQNFYRLPTDEELKAEWQAHTKRYQDLYDAQIDYKMDQEGMTQEMLDNYYKSRKEAVGAEKEAIELEEKEFFNKWFRAQEEESYPLVDWLSLPKNASQVSPQTTTSFPRDLRLFLSSFQDRLFVQDRIFGSDPRTELRVRLITNSPNMASVFENMVFRTSTQVGPQEFRPPLVVFHAVNFLDEQPGSKYGAEGDQEICLFDFLKGNVFLSGRGVEDVQVFRSLLTKACFHYFPSRSVVPLPAYVLSPSFSNPPIAVMHNPESSLLEKYFNEQGNKNVYANQHALWSDFGVSSLLSDISRQPSQRGDVIQHIVNNNKEERVNYIARRKDLPAVLSHPKKIVLVSTSSSTSSALSPAELISEHLNQNFSSFPVRLDKWAEALNRNIEKHQVKVEKVTLKSESLADLKKSLASVLA